MFAAGAATPVAAAALSGSMITAIKTVTGPKGLWTQKGGDEYNLVLLAAVFGLTENGPGQWSVEPCSAGAAGARSGPSRRSSVEPRARRRRSRRLVTRSSSTKPKRPSRRSSR